MTSPTDRLSLTTLGRVADTGVVPTYDPRDVTVGSVHLGVGAFFRAHQAVYTDAALGQGEQTWGVCGVSQRSRTVPDQLDPQDGLYSVLVRDADLPPRAQVVGAIREVLPGGEAADDVVERIARSTTHLVTLTVTEKGYRHDASTGRLRRDDDGIAADLAGRPPRTVVGQIVRGLQRRRQRDAGPLTVMSCDNLTSNGVLLRGLVSDFVSRLPAEEATPLASWIEESVTFPSTMVDRIVPATTAADRAEAARLLGLRDEATVVAEPFTQWVIEDAFGAPRPRWEVAGATLTDDVEAYERVKLRLLNATHSLVAYLGVLAGHDTIAAALQDPVIEHAAERLLDEDQMPTLTPPDGMDLREYGDEVLRRFANPALGHRTTQVAMDGSQKLPQRLLGAVRERRSAGAVPTYGALLVAAWMRALEGDVDGRHLDIEDPMRAEVREQLRSGRSSADCARLVLGLRQIFGDDLGSDDEFVDAVAGWYYSLRNHGVHDALRAGVTH